MRCKGLLLAGVLSVTALSAQAEDVAYGYDALGRLISVTYTNGGATKTITYAYDAAGNRTQVAVADGGGNLPPVANTDTKTTPFNTVLTFDPRINDTDPNGDALTVTAVGGTPAKGLASYASTSVTYTPNTGATGADSFTYTISDGQGGTAVGTVNVTISSGNQAPDAVNDSRTAQKNTALSFDPRSNDSDPDGGTLSVVGVSTAAHGTVGYTSTSVTFTPTTGYTGADSFTYTLSDGQGGSDTATVSITVNAPPVAVGDSKSTTLNTPLTFDPRTNDSDSDGGTLSVTGVGTAAHGTVGYTPTSATFTPTTGYTGSDSFTYTLSDGQGGTATATVSLTITSGNQPPVATDDYYFWTATSLPTSWVADVLTNDTDPESNTLSILSRTTPTNGATATIVGANINVTNIGGLGTSFSYTISDGNGGTDVGYVELTPDYAPCPEGEIC